MSLTNPAAPPSPTPPKYLDNKQSITPDTDNKKNLKQESQERPVLHILHPVHNSVCEAGLVVHEIAQFLSKSLNADVAGMNHGS
jgi:hypothetical protein